MIEVQEKRLNEVHSSIRHGFFGRRGGQSTGLYESLNCGIGSGDDANTVQANRALVASQLIDNVQTIQTISQIHSATCCYIDDEIGSHAGLKGGRPEGDALVTDKAGLVIGVLTADCGPVLFAGTKADGAPIIGAAHAGWGGAVKGVCEATIKTMIDHGADMNSITAVIGPCIGPKSYEVSVGFETPFMEQDDHNEHFFKSAQAEGKLMFDLPGYIAARIAGVGVKNVVITGVDTFAEEKRFFSYRLTTHRAEPDYGRQISAIGIEK